MTSSLDQMWRCARRLGLRRGAGNALPPLLYFTDPERTPRPHRILALLPRGAGIVYRAFGAADALVEGRRLKACARERGVVFLVGADQALAVALRADGIHWPERLAFRPGVNRRLRRRFLLTGASHSLPAILRGRRSGLDALIVSPVFASRSPSAGRALGARRLAILVRASTLPVFALGGVNAATSRGLRATGAVGMAAIDGLNGTAGDPTPGTARGAPGIRT